MQLFKTSAKQLVRASLSACFGGRESIPIMVGPLKGKHLPKPAALNNLPMVFGQYESHVVRELLSLPEPLNTAYDIGAHIGFMTLVLTRCVGKSGRVFAFEPVPDNLLLIEQMVSQNDLQERVKIIPFALGNTDAQQNMFVYESSSVNFLATTFDGQNIGECQVIKVSTSTLDSFIFEQSNPAPDLLKIDVEGAEALVMEGALRTLEVYYPKILIEIHGPKNARKIWELLQSFRYSWNKLTLNGRVEVSYEKELLSYFSKDSWTHHFLLVSTSSWK